MSDNIKTLCSSKVNSIKSTSTSTEKKAANVKMVKKVVFFLILSSTWGGKPAGVVLAGPWNHGNISSL